MSQKYMKPLFAIETFSAAVGVTRDCADSIPAGQVTYNDIASCKWDIGGGQSLFVEGATCTKDGEKYSFACYNNPGEGAYIFRS